MNEFTKRYTEQIADKLKEVMQKKGVTAEMLTKGNNRKPQLYKVLKMGKLREKSYEISTLCFILDVLDYDIEFVPRVHKKEDLNDDLLS